VAAATPGRQPHQPRSPRRPPRRSIASSGRESRPGARAHSSARRQPRAAARVWCSGTRALAPFPGARGGYHGLQSATARRQHLRPARRGLMVGTSTALLLRLYPDAAVVRARRLQLQAMRLSVFGWTGARALRGSAQCPLRS
jgi:hypothetical protein